MSRTFDPRLLDRLRCPVTRGPLEFRPLRGPDEGGKVGILIAREAGLWFPLVDGVPVLLPYATPAMEAFARDHAATVADFGDLTLPPAAGGASPEEEHYELHGIDGVGAGPFDVARRAAALDMVPADARSILDLGAGPGLFLADLERARPAITALGLERSGAAIRAARCAASVTQGTAERLPLGDGTVDGIVTMEMLEHLPTGVHERALAEIARVAARFVLVNVPYRERRLQAECPACGCLFNPSYHMRSYDDDALEGLLPGFRLAARRLLPRRENLMKALAAPFRRRVFGGFVDYAICPQCGYRRSSPPPHGIRRGPRTLLRALGERLPPVPIRGEILVLYERDGT